MMRVPLLVEVYCEGGCLRGRCRGLRYAIGGQDEALELQEKKKDDITPARYFVMA